MYVHVSNWVLAILLKKNRKVDLFYPIPFTEELIGVSKGDNSIGSLKYLTNNR